MRMEPWHIRKDYQAVFGRSHLLPICDVFLLGPRGKVRQRVLIDSGADYSVFAAKAAEDAGVVLRSDSCCPVQYGGSVSAGWRIRVSIAMDDQVWQAHVIFAQVLQFPYGLLGRIDVFSRFREVAFMERRPSPCVIFRCR